MTTTDLELTGSHWGFAARRATCGDVRECRRSGANNRSMP